MNKTGNAGIFAETMSVWSLPPVWTHCSTTLWNLQTILCNSWFILDNSLSELCLRLFIYFVDLSYNSRKPNCNASNDTKNGRKQLSEEEEKYISADVSYQFVDNVMQTACQVIDRWLMKSCHGLSSLYVIHIIFFDCNFSLMFILKMFLVRFSAMQCKW